MRTWGRECGSFLGLLMLLFRDLGKLAKQESQSSLQATLNNEVCVTSRRAERFLQIPPFVFDIMGYTFVSPSKQPAVGPINLSMYFPSIFLHISSIYLSIYLSI